MSFTTLYTINNYIINGNLESDFSTNTLFFTDNYSGASPRPPNNKVNSIGTNGSNFNILSSFSPSEMLNGGLLRVGNVLYGTTNENGSIFVLYSVHTDGTNLTTLYSFSSLSGLSFLGNLIISGNILYGVAIQGSGGILYSYDITQTAPGNIVTLYTFPLNNTFIPNEGLLLVGNILYGTGTGIIGGLPPFPASTYGVIYSYDLSQSAPGNIVTLYTFTNGVDQANPNGGLVFSNNNLYGTTTGSLGRHGTIFAYNITQPSPGSLDTLYTFSGGNDGSEPNGNLLLIGNTLYGTTIFGGTNNYGTIFSFLISGSIKTLYSFRGTSDRSYPNGGVIANGNILYGTTNNTIFSFSRPIICFDESTKILCLVDDQEIYLPISELTSQHIVKIYQHNKVAKYNRIKAVGSSTVINDPTKWQNCMYYLPNNSVEGQFDDLVITGGHSILVDSLSFKQMKLQSQWWVNGFSKIEDKLRLLASLDERFVQIIEPKEFTYYHLVVEGPLERYGIYANGVLSESCTSKVFDEYHFDLIK